jgi:hypothetical protein
MKTSVWAVTIFFIAYFAAPHTNAAWINPTNYWQFANHQPVPVDQVTNIAQAPTDLGPADAQPEQPHGKLLAPVIFFVIVLAAFAYIIYQLIKLLDKVIPPPEKQAPPPPNAGDTNLPPITINPTTGPGPAIAGLKTKALKIDSNTPSWGPVTYYNI